MRMRVIYIALVLILLSSAAFAHRPFTLDQPLISDILNDYWSIYGTVEGANGIAGCDDMIHASTFWYEWNTLKCSWTNYGPFQEVQRLYFDMAKISGYNAEGQQPRGYLWPGFHSEKWFGLHEHFDQLPRFVCSIYNDYVWSRDRKFLKQALPKAEAVMEYMLKTMNGESGITACPSPNDGLSDTGVPSTYMDCLREGHIAGWINAPFYAALQNMAELEKAAGDLKKSKKYADIARLVPQKFDEYLWNTATGRYAGWKDIKGNLHDAGYTFVNVEALARGLGNPEKAYRIFQWLEGKQAQPTVKGAHIGSTDVYQLVVAPRANTLRVPNADWDGWSMPERNSLGDNYQFGYGAALEDGGTMLWINYYDVMARLKWMDANNAWKKYSQMLYRCANDPRFLTVGHDHKYSFNPNNSYGENYLELGTDFPFPESGISAMSMLYGFMGVWPHYDGLAVSPNLPSNLTSAECKDVAFSGTPKTIRIEKGQTLINDKPAAAVEELSAAATSISRQFSTNKRFNKIGVMLGIYRNPQATAIISLSRILKNKQITVLSCKLTTSEDNAWVYTSIPDQPAGDYMVTLNYLQDKIAWYKTSKGNPAIRIVFEKPANKTSLAYTNEINEQVFEVPHTFGRISIATASDAASTITLYRQMGTNWLEVQRQEFLRGDDVALTISDQPAGRYRISLSNTKASIKKIVCEQGIYSVKISPGKLRFNINAGDTRTITDSEWTKKGRMIHSLPR